MYDIFTELKNNAHFQMTDRGPNHDATECIANEKFVASLYETLKKCESIGNFGKCEMIFLIAKECLIGVGQGSHVYPVMNVCKKN